MSLRARHAALLAVCVTAGVVATDHFRWCRRVQVQHRLQPLPVVSHVVVAKSAEPNLEPIAKGDPVESAPVSLVGTGALDDDIVVKIRELAETDPAAVAEAALKQPVSQLRERMLIEALPHWADHDPAAAAEWLCARQPARELDLGLSALARNPVFIVKTPEVALGLASEITDPSLRIAAQRTIVQIWMQRDPARLRGLLQQTSDLNAGDRAMLLSELDGLLASR
ncbi:MAG: hypothetical protein QM790_16585 [Nibricoccus sp.]